MIVKWLIGLVDFLGGCTHEHRTFPMTPPRKGDEPKTCYEVCLDCGKHLPYTRVDFGGSRSATT